MPAPETLPGEETLLRTLPPVLRAVVRALGFNRAWEWLERHGGVSINLPNHRTAALELTPDELMRLRETLAPHLDAMNRVSLPKADKLFIRARNEQIRRERLRMSLSALAKSYRLSSRQIVNICRLEADNDQPQLF
ncbi:MAG: hypothetical protein LBJ59_08690 [Zoogloeaceae bacterium]|jgi:hypothetical protein|nr:hypothetical protein [Zoogloeaceae bacterium]